MGLSLGHAIPSTLAGYCIDQNTGQVNEAKLRENLSLAISAYISRVYGCPMADTTISLYEESTSMEHHTDSEKNKNFS